ncbi:MAG TPA: site-2 protease family protein [Pyrinomonadaceae bacterium]|nr:site-2 protease family protein [Pyrinomonadaceae bacterium]
MRSWSLRIGKLFGIEVFIHWTFWILIVWIFLMHLRMGDGLRQGAWGALFVLALFGCVVAHEFGHALMARRFGVVTKDITLYPIGGIASLEGMPERSWQELLVAIVGPFVNLVIAAALWIYLTVSGQMPNLAAMNADGDVVQLPFLFSLFLANIILAVFNLIPAFPMDGGRAFRSILSFWMDKTTATRIAAGIGQLLAIVFVFFGFFYNFWLVFIGLFIYLGAGGEAAYVQTQSALAGLKVKDALMRRFTILKPDDSLGVAVDALLNSQESEFVIADAGKPVGLLTKNEIIRGLSEAGKEALVTAFMKSDFFVVSSETALTDFFRQVLEQGRSVAIVMDGDVLQGLIDRENVEERLMIQQALANQ